LPIADPQPFSRQHSRSDRAVCTRAVARLLSATTCLKHQAALSVAYGAGLRVAEVAGLKVSDIDSERMLLRVERGKGGQYRNAMLSTDLLALLRQWWRVGRHPDDASLGPGEHPLGHELRSRENSASARSSNVGRL
jgi:integrase/recombinase XerD